jgi:putative DNA methylase
MSYSAISLDRLADYSSSICNWHLTGEKITDTFQRYALQIKWDFVETVTCSEKTGGYQGAIEWIARFIENASNFGKKSAAPKVLLASSMEKIHQDFDVILTDPPYYDAIPYSDLMDFFYIWLRRILYKLSPEINQAFQKPLGPKWDHKIDDGELIDDPVRFKGDKIASKKNYEDGMARAFQACYAALKPNGRFVVVFAHKQPDAWETLASAMIKAGFVVTASWPIQTEMANRTRALTSAALASSIWMVCKKRPATAKPRLGKSGIDRNAHHITQQLRDFWDAGIRGPDFVWAATGPALESFSQYPAVRKVEGGVMTIGEFLNQVRRFVVDFVVGRVLSQDNPDGASAAAEQLDDLTAYYLLHRHDFGFEPAPIGQVILYGQSCGLSDRTLLQTWDLLANSKTAVAESAEDEDAAEANEAESASPGGATVKLKAWHQRKDKNLGMEAPGGQAVPLIDRIHRLMQLWKAGQVAHVDEYLDTHGLRGQELFKRVLQAVLELSAAGSEERAVLESLSNHLGVKIARPISGTLPGM